LQITQNWVHGGLLFDVIREYHALSGWSLIVSCEFSF
jgi:hypothetical protein